MPRRSRGPRRTAPGSPPRPMASAAVRCRSRSAWPGAYAAAHAVPPDADMVRPMRVVVLGAGFGGLELTTRLSEALGDEADVVLIDQSDGFIFGFSKLDVMFGRRPSTEVRHHYADIVKPGVRFVRATIQSIDPNAKRVETDVGSFDGDVLVVALGADLHPEATPGLVEGGNEFYTVAGAF